MYFCTMRNSFSFSIKDKKGFAKKLFFWTKRFKYSCFLDSNISQHNSPISYRNYDFIVAHALASQYLGHKFIYLECGSNADKTIDLKLLSEIS